MINLLFPKRDFSSPKEQGADFVELFFDLVFVYAITKITFFVAHDLDGKHVLQAMLIFWLIWWAWTQFTWALNAANTKFAEIRLGVLVATAIAFIMASSVPDAFSDQVFWFAIPYIVIRILGLGLYVRITPPGLHKKADLRFALMSSFGLTAVLLGALATPENRIWFWLAAIILDMIASSRGSRSNSWFIRTAHFAERHSLIVIIALGESLIVAASAITNQDRTLDLIIIGGLAVLITCSLWWSYFAWINETMEHAFNKAKDKNQGKIARDAYSMMHFPLICGIISIAIAFEKIMEHPDEMLTIPVAGALCGGFVLFSGFTAAAIYRTNKLMLWPRIISILVASIAIFFTVGHPPQYGMALIAICLLVLFFFEWKRCSHTG